MSVRTRRDLWPGDLFDVAKVLRSLHLLRNHPDVPRKERKKSAAESSREIERSKRWGADLLSFTHVDAALAIRRQTVELDGIFLVVLKEARHRSRGQRIDDGDVERASIQGDPDWLRQLFLILVDIALDHSPRTGRIKASLHQSGGQVIGTIEDDGAGIRPEEFLWVHERFDWEDPTGPVSIPGIGPALAFAAWIAEQHEGDLGFATAPLKGTRATVCFPANQSDRSPSHQGQALSRWSSAPSLN